MRPIRVSIQGFNTIHNRVRELSSCWPASHSCSPQTATTLKIEPNVLPDTTIAMLSRVALYQRMIEGLTVRLTSFRWQSQATYSIHFTTLQSLGDGYNKNIFHTSDIQCMRGIKKVREILEYFSCVIGNTAEG
jgi:hypothetical protein